MSIDGRGSSPSRQAQNRIAALVSMNERLTERVAVLEGVAQANADDRDAYAERAAELEQENGRLKSRTAYLDGWKQQAEKHFEPTLETS